MYNASGKIIYVGKAKNLKNRVSSYFNRPLDVKTTRMVANISNIEVTITANEQEAYILELSLIKSHRPKYNVIFKDDKSYPYIKLSKDEFPILSSYRGAKSRVSGKIFGPYPNSYAVKETIDLLQKTFKLRNCSNIFFRNRTRPCLQYQINRCTAPCVGYINREDYNKDVSHVVDFLNGKATGLIKNLVAEMESFSKLKEYEKAAAVRNKISHLKSIQQNQVIESKYESTNLDVLSLSINDSACTIFMLSIRNGRIIGSKHFSLDLQNLINDLETSVLESFILQHYVTENFSPPLPTEIIVSEDLSNKIAIESVLEKEFNKKIKISNKVKGQRAKWLSMADSNSKISAEAESLTKVDYKKWFDALRNKLGIQINCIACFDISHTQGYETVAAVVVFTDKGPDKPSYRRFNIKTAKGGDDYKAMEEAVSRYVNNTKDLADFIIVDGGKGQLNIAKQVLDLIEENVYLISVAKGEGRKPGLEKVYAANPDFEIIDFAKNDYGFLLIQNIRDEAHRFVITGHRSKLKKRTLHSSLEDIPGVGPIKRKSLLSHLGGMQELMQATLDDICMVPGINKSLAERIYSSLHGKI